MTNYDKLVKRLRANHDCINSLYGPQNTVHGDAADTIEALTILATQPAAPKPNAYLDALVDEIGASVDFFDRIKGLTEDEKIAVGHDHWDRIESAARKFIVALRSCGPLKGGEA